MNCKPSMPPRPGTSLDLGRVTRVLLAGAGVAVGVLAPSAVASADEGRVQCRSTYVPVSGPVAGSPRSWIFGELCARDRDLHDGATVQLLLHGATYDHGYWDFGRVNGVTYSYSRALAAAGTPTFAVDNLGTGRSSHPATSELSFEGAAATLHDVVQRLRRGDVGGTRFRTVILVGNSMGALISWQEAATYHDVDGVIITGMGHHFSQQATDFLIAAFYSAIDDPELGVLDLDPGYLTTRPGTRSGIFYGPADRDPSVLALDEERKDVVPAPFFDGIPLTADLTTRAIDVPVLHVMGSNDVLCDAAYTCASASQVLRDEAPFYAPSARLQACVIQGGGHSLALHREGHVALEQAAIAWTRGLRQGSPGSRMPDFCAR